jgi:soluble lytic murein transglycosylase-like protein
MLRFFLSCFFLTSLCVFSIQAVANNIPVPEPKPKSVKKESTGFFSLLPKRKPSLEVEKHVTVPIYIEKKGPFSERQAVLYRDIFDLQRAGKIKQADEKIESLNSSLLMGHVLAERYLHPTAYQSSYPELENWLTEYADHPQAEAIYKLALIKNPEAENILPKPKRAKKISGNLASVSKRAKLYKKTVRRNADQEKRVQKLKQDLHRHVEKFQPTLAFNILNNDYALQFMDDVEYDRLRAEIAAGYLYAGKMNLALQLANDSIKRSEHYVPLAAWVKGLIDWKNRRFESSAKAFEVAASSAYSSGWLISASAYWASRAHIRSRNMKPVSKWLEVSASYPRTFYGLIAAKALGRVSNFNWSVPPLKKSHLNFLKQLPKGRRAMALIKADRKDLAEQELQTLIVGRSKSGQESLLAFAHHYNLPSVLMRLGNAFYQPQGSLYNAALYPLPSWEPKNGFRIDRALIFAITRQESRFNNLAQNPSGATGLMQLMPATANYISGKEIYHKAEGRYQLSRPEINLKIGQKYIEELLNHPAVNNDLLLLAMAYNAGPGNLSKWKRKRKDIKDPLLFIETIPFTETRAFVERVMANYWIYQMRLNQDTPSLTAISEGRWAPYTPQDKDVRKIAFRN